MERVNHSHDVSARWCGRPFRQMVRSLAPNSIKDIHSVTGLCEICRLGEFFGVLGNFFSCWANFFRAGRFFVFGVFLCWAIFIRVGRFLFVLGEFIFVPGAIIYARSRRRI
jgi:hypothetical protein